LDKESQKRTTKNSGKPIKRQSKYFMTYLPSKPNHNEAEEARIIRLIEAYVEQRSQQQESVIPSDLGTKRRSKTTPGPVKGI
jgi:hypothetical protein